MRYAIYIPSLIRDAIHSAVVDAMLIRFGNVYAHDATEYAHADDATRIVSSSYTVYSAFADGIVPAHAEEMDDIARRLLRTFPDVPYVLWTYNDERRKVVRTL